MSDSVRSLLVNAATEYDRRASTRKGYNPYALAHYFRAIDNCAEDMQDGLSIRAAILRSFNGKLCDAMLRAVGEPCFTREEMLSQPISR